ncbi:MAG: aspartate--ammonia ligase [Spirochaetaceae bacterium]|nr:aspartate--ammonia ligase [Spirochaetaceae bacterium]
MPTITLGKPKKLSLLETERAIAFVKKVFQSKMESYLNLIPISAPLFTSADSGVQDNLNGTENAVSFKIKSNGNTKYEIVHSLAKWKRTALKRYNAKPGQGIITNMKALRPDEPDLTSRIHSVYVDQWDWEKVIETGDRNLDFLKSTVRLIFQSIKGTAERVNDEFGIPGILPEEISFVHTEDLVKKWPDKTPKERENLITRSLGAVFIIGIGGELPDGSIHDGRAPDYDDWTSETLDGKHGLNGDIMVWNPILARAFELSSMGIRVDSSTMLKQLEIRGEKKRAKLNWHKDLLNGNLPQTIGGGIGQSRLSMFILHKKHIGEVHVSEWPEEVLNSCKEMGIELL